MQEVLHHNHDVPHAHVPHMDDIHDDVHECPKRYAYHLASHLAHFGPFDDELGKGSDGREQHAPEHEIVEDKDAFLGTQRDTCKSRSQWRPKRLLRVSRESEQGNGGRQRRRGSRAEGGW